MVLLFNTLAVATSVVVASLHAVAIQYSLYWTYLWFDIPMHTLGGLMFGFWTGAVSLRIKLSASRAALLTGVVVLSVSVVWEIFEFVSGLTALKQGFWLDTMGDIFFAAAGAFLAYLLYLLARRHAISA